MKKKRISNHTVLTLGFIFIIALVTFVISQSTPNPSHNINQITGIPECGSSKFLSNIQGQLRCIDIPQPSSQPFVFGDSFPIDELNHFVTSNFQVKEIDRNTNTYEGYLNMGFRARGTRFNNFQVEIIGNGIFISESSLQNFYKSTKYINVYGQNLNVFSGNIQLNTNKIINLDLSPGTGGDTISFYIKEADKNTKIKFKILSRTNNNFLFEQVSYGMRKYQNNWGNINDEFEFYLSQ